MNKKLPKGLAFFLAGLLIFSLLFYFLIPVRESGLKHLGQKLSIKKSATFNYVAIGDSLTEGVGDTTEQGGFIPLLSQELQTSYHYDVASNNYGVSGNTSQQILTRMSEEKKIQKSLTRANLMTLTVGGNDVMAVIRKDLTNLKASSFTKPAQVYQKHLREIIELARQKNKNLPIYVVGIYNPYYLNFPDLTQMQEIIDKWNQGTQKVTAEYENVYFVSINELLYKGTDSGQTAVETPSSESDSGQITNNVLSEDDRFHPNNVGYQIMSKAVMEKISETKKNWN
ncbi:SGNH/GDSL hydrolase family protein [Streptococcus caviae]|uniref:SGNH/GDSL hydrolase family protein n=1 Tax=Streptococcus sp. 'caviae' TaxID=1915004 RepID=UPI00094B906E|nr:SGNH/GDSL hydrolase family protein [Streptococcus sp. 'caviae']OLN84073.1 GDSL family lipase [Streptococcus sp. 'caviae']